MMNILIAPNDYYVMPGLAMLQSLFDTNQEKMKIFVLQNHLSDKNRKKLSRIARKNDSEILFVDVPDNLFDTAFTSAHISKETYFRLMAHALLPAEIDRILYLDLDIIVNGDLSVFYNTPFVSADRESYFIVCEGPGVSRNEWPVYDKLGIPHENKYFNSGVMLMNLNLMRKDIAPTLLSDYALSHKDSLKYHDQDVLNALFYDRVIYADWHIYNQTILHIRDAEEAAARQTDAAIIHYAGSFKPWKYNYNSWFLGLYWKYACRAGLGYLLIPFWIKRTCWHIHNKIHRKHQ